MLAHDEAVQATDAADVMHYVQTPIGQGISRQAVRYSAPRSVRQNQDC